MTEIDWSLLGRYTAGECTEAERAAVGRWLASAPAGSDTIRAIARVAAQADRTSSPVRKQERFARLQTRLATEGACRQVPSRAAVPVRWRRSAMKMAAGITLLLGGSFAAFAALHRPATRGVSDAMVHTIATAPGERMSLHLSDGTEVRLGPASTLRVPVSFGASTRIVELEGEAAFRVTHDPHRPFAVRTTRFEVRDLGTRFVVQAYADDTLGHVAVAEGRVAVAHRTGADSVVLLPSDAAQVTRAGAVAVTRGVVIDAYFGWTEGHLVFRRTTLGDALQQIERWHNVKVDLASPTLATRRFSASFEHGESAAEMLQVIGAVLDLQLQQTDRRRFALAPVR